MHVQKAGTVYITIISYFDFCPPMLLYLWLKYWLMVLHLTLGDLEPFCEVLAQSNLEELVKIPSHEKDHRIPPERIF